MSSDADDQRVREIKALFEEKGWRLLLEREDNGVWSAAFWLSRHGGMAQEAEGYTRLQAAEAAWAMYEREPWLGGPPPAEWEGVA